MSELTGPSYEEQVRAIESMLRSVLGNAKYDYLSGPITGGPRFIRWQLEVGEALSGDLETYSMLIRRQVIGPNIDDLIALAKKKREEKRSIIEPASFESPSRLWSQNEFYRLWEQVITEHAESVLFKDGWHLSVGCVYEYLCAVRGSRSCFDESDAPLSVERACKLISDGIQEITPDKPILAKHRTRLEAMMNAIKFAASET